MHKGHLFISVITVALFAATGGAWAQDAAKPVDAKAKPQTTEAEADGPVIPPDITIQRTPVPTLLGDTTGVRLEGFEVRDRLRGYPWSHPLYLRPRRQRRIQMRQDVRAGLAPCRRPGRCGGDRRLEHRYGCRWHAAMGL